MSDLQHIEISRADLAKILIEAHGMSLDDFEIVNLDLISRKMGQILQIYQGPWTDQACPFETISFTVKKNVTTVQRSEDEGAV